jgi:hypothetical protein
MPDNLTEIDRLPVADLPQRYGISRNTLYESRLNPLGIKPVREGNASYINADQVRSLDQLDAHIKAGGKVSDFINAPKNSQLVSAEPSTPAVSTAQPSDLQSNLLNALLYAIAEANSRQQNTYTITKDELDLTQERYKKLLWYAENQIQLASDELRCLIGIKPSGSEFTRGSFTFTRMGKIGNQSAWSIQKIKKEK